MHPHISDSADQNSAHSSARSVHPAARSGDEHRGEHRGGHREYLPLAIVLTATAMIFYGVIVLFFWRFV